MRINNEKCPFCGQQIDWNRLLAESSLYQQTLETEDIYYPQLCCEELEADFMENNDVWSSDTWERCAYASEKNDRVRSVIEDNHNLNHVDFCLTTRLLNKPGDQKMAKEFINKYHRHNQAPVGWLYGIACDNGPTLIGIAWVGRPIARLLARNNDTVEVNRLCVRTDIPPQLVWNACSQLYGAAAREAEQRGYQKIITYTLESEVGTSLKAVQWVPVAKSKGGQTWNRPGRKRIQKAPTIPKIRWEKILSPHIESSEDNVVGLLQTLVINNNQDEVCDQVVD
ncbi:MAG: XF1762 family protein [Acidobacteriota bacterium]